MASLSKYCKAISVEKLRQFSNWSEKLSPLTVKVSEEAGPGSEKTEPVFSYLYLHHDYTVTAGVTAGEKVVFDQVTDDWKEFCGSTLHFGPPS